MRTEMWSLPLLLALVIPSALPLAPPLKLAPKVKVYTADTAREIAQASEPSPRPSVGTNLDELYDEIAPASTSEPDNKGFVDPIDFNSFLSNVGFNGKQSEKSPLFSASSNNQGAFADFFKSASKNSDPFQGQGFGGISSSASNQKSRKPDGTDTDDSGFVDPDVQFRSLFDSTETADGFRPQDFLGAKDNHEGVEPSKGSQTRAFPSFTYTGRYEDDDRGNRGNDREQDREDEITPEANNPNNRYRSSYRQVNSRDREPSQGGSYDPYDDGNYYGGDYDESPPAPPNPRHRQQQSGGGGGNQRFSQRQGAPNSHSSEETSPAAQTSGPKPAESASGKQKCKKVEKQVDYEEDYAGYVEPEGDYDPSTYGQNERYKRQAGRGGGGGGGGGRGGKNNKRPMTCYVCEDEQGRYAERCSYDSKADPKQGSYFHSESTSFNDNGKRQGGRGGRGSGQDRYRRNPSKATAKPATSASSKKPVTVAEDEKSSEREKRQSGRGQQRQNQENEGFDDDYQDERDDRDDGQASREREDFDDYGDGGGYNSGPGASGNAPRGSSSSNRGGGGRTGGGGNNRDADNYGFGPPQRGRGNEFDFGPPSDFGRGGVAAAGSSNRDFDFSIPRDFDPDVQIGTSNSNNRPIFSGSNSNSNNNNDDFGPTSFDGGYEDYVKKYFPAAFAEHAPASGPTHSTPGPASTSSYSPVGNGRPSSSSSTNYPRGHVPNKENTQQTNQYAPPPFYQQENDGNLHKLIGDFNGRDRSGCQKIVKGDMTCYVCRDAKGMNKEECMYSSNDPNGKNTRMAYHESTEYSSPPASIVPLPRPKVAQATQPQSQESKTEENKKPVEYDFDY